MSSKYFKEHPNCLILFPYKEFCFSSGMTRGKWLGKTLPLYTHRYNVVVTGN